MTTLAVISGISALWLGGAAAAAAFPIIAHFLSRRGGPTLDFPAVRFVQIAAAEQAARERPRDLFLLLLRVLIIALIALAFDRPVWSTTSNPDIDTAQGEDIVIVIDASASMTRSHAQSGGRAYFEIARSRALEELEAAQSAGARTAVILASLNPEAILPRLTDQSAPLAARLREASVTLQRADMQSAIALAATLPAPTDEPLRPRRVIVFSDMQASNFQGVSVPASVTLDLRSIADQAPPRNLAVSDIEISPPRPIAGRESIVSVKVTNFSDAPARPTVTCDAASSQRSLSPNLAPGASTTLSFPITFPAATQTPVRVSLIDASFTHDDAAYLVADVRQARRIALITAAPDSDRRGGAYFASLALAPTETSEFRVIRVAPTQATPELLASFDAVIIAQAALLPDSAPAAIRAALEQSVGVLWVIDSQPAYESAAAFNAPTPSLPVTLNSRFTQLAGDEHLTLRPADLDRGPLALFEGPATRALLDATFNTSAPADLAPASVPLILMSNGDPFIAWRTGPRATGRIITINADLAPDHTSLVKGPMFPVLMHELLRFILPASAARQYAEVGELLTTRVPAALTFSDPVADPLDRPVRVTRGSASAAFDPILNAPPADAPGITDFHDASANIIARAATNLAPAESDPRALDDAAIAELTDAPDASIRLTAAAPGASITRQAIELWPWLLAAAIASLAIESLIAGFNRRASTPERDA